MDEEVPIHSRELLAQLDKAYPVRNPDPGYDRDKLMYDAGWRALIDFLLARSGATRGQPSTPLEPAAPVTERVPEQE